MVLNLSVGFDKLVREDGKSERDKTYALFIADTVVVGKDGAEVLLIFARYVGGVDLSIVLVNFNCQWEPDTMRGTFGNIKLRY